MINNQDYLDLIDDVYKVFNDFEELRNKKILIIGSTGTIGSFLIDTLMRRNAIYNDNITVYAGSRSIENIKKVFSNYMDNKLFVPFVCDITQNFDFNEKVDYIIHAGSDSYPSAFSSHPVEIMQSNILGTNNLLNYCRYSNARLLYISSGEVYGSYTDNTPIKEGYLGYIDNLRARSCYPISKRSAETLCITYKEEYNTQVVIARLSHIYSPYYKKEDNKVHIKFIESALAGEDIVFKRGVEHIRSYTFIVDAVSAILTILIKGENGEVYNVSNEKSVISLEDMAKMISQLTNTNLKYENILDEKNNENLMNYAVLDNTKLKSLSWYGLYSFENGIAKTLALSLEKENKKI